MGKGRKQAACGRIQNATAEIIASRQCQPANASASNSKTATGSQVRPDGAGLGAGSSFISSSRRACCPACRTCWAVSSRLIRRPFSCWACCSCSRKTATSAVSGAVWGAVWGAVSCDITASGPRGVSCGASFSGPNTRISSARSTPRPPAASTVADNRPVWMARCKVLRLIPAARAASLMLTIKMRFSCGLL